MAVSEQDAYHALAFKTGRYTSTPFKERLCRLCSCGRWRTKSTFWPSVLLHYILELNHLVSMLHILDSNFHHSSHFVKTKFISCWYNDLTIKLLSLKCLFIDRVF